MEHHESEYKRFESAYDIIAWLCISLTNWHAKLHPFREADGRLYNKLRNRMDEIVQKAAEKRRRVQERYRYCRRRRLDNDHCLARRHDSRGDAVEDDV